MGDEPQTNIADVQPVKAQPKPVSSLAAAAVLLLLTLAAYWPILTHDFVNCDDPVYVTENVRVQSGLNGANVIWAFTTTEAEFWHPLTWLSHMLDCQCFGLRAWGHHLTNLLLHLANTLLVFFCFEALTGARGRSFMVAALFGLHPLHVESAAWVAERKDLLSTLFFLLALWAYGRYAEGRSPKPEGRRHDGHRRFPFHASRSTLHAPRFYALSLLFFALGLMSKPMVVTLPFVLLLLDYWPLRRFSLTTNNGWLSTIRSLLLEKVPFFALAMLESIAAWWIQHSRHNLGQLTEFPLVLRMSNALVSYGRYVRRTFWPSDLAVFYPYPQHWPMAWVLAAAALLAAVTFSAIWLIRRRPYIAVGWFWFLGMLVPVIGLVQVGRHAMADRYTYLPLIGLFLLLVWTIGDLLGVVAAGILPAVEPGILPGAIGLAQTRTPEPGGRMPAATVWCRQTAVVVVACAALAACFVLTHRQLRYWQNSETLARRALAVTKDNYVAEMDLGAALQHAGKLDQAVSHYLSALKIQPNHAPAHNNLALALAAQGNKAQAILHLREALRIEPRYASAHYLLGTFLDQQDRAEEALAEYQEALRLQPDFPEAANDLGGLLAARGQWNEALACFTRAVRLRPDYAEAHNNLGTAYMTFGKLPDAAQEFEAALRFKPDYPDAHANLGKALYYQRRTAEAALHFAAVLKSTPDSLEALDLLARIRAASPDAQVRNGAEALRLAGRAAEITGRTNAPVLDSLAAAYAEAGRFADAVQTAEVAARQASASGQTNLAVQLAERVKLYRAQRPLRE